VRHIGAVVGRIARREFLGVLVRRHPDAPFDDGEELAGALVMGRAAQAPALPQLDLVELHILFEMQRIASRTDLVHYRARCVSRNGIPMPETLSNSKLLRP
jgi:hypothetical protein